jgi:GTP-binding protein HflX
LENIRETLRVNRERAILVSAPVRFRDNDDLAELTSLAQTAGAIIAGHFQQKLQKISSKTYIGKGKAEELAERVKAAEANVVIFDNDLSPAQIRELEEIVKVKILDRSELILDIFATRAQTKQAKLQVALAQLEYTYPRLTRMWSHLDSVAGAGGGTTAGAVGGIGTRGTGEQQLEIDRRIVSKRITELKRELEVIDERKMREIDGRKSLYKICLVGYTNAGKSTLMNALTDAGVFVENKLFATLDTRTKKWSPSGGIEILLSDTVGFIRNLPHHLVASFRATLEEAVNADLLLHVIDVSNEEVTAQIEAVNKALNKIGCKGKPLMMLFNKVDAVKSLGQLEMLQTLYPDALSISAKTGLGLVKLNEIVLAKYKGSEQTFRITVPLSDGKIQSFLRAYCTILKQDYLEDCVVLEAMVGQKQVPELKKLKPLKMEIID